MMTRSSRGVLRSVTRPMPRTASIAFCARWPIAVVRRSRSAMIASCGSAGSMFSAGAALDCATSSSRAATGTGALRRAARGSLPNSASIRFMRATEPVRQDDLSILFAQTALDRDDPLGAVEMTGKLPLGGFNICAEGKVPGRGGGELRGTGGAQPDGAARAVHDVCNRLDDALAQRTAPPVASERIDEAMPFDAVIVFVAEEVLVDEHVQLAARSTRRDDDGEEDACGGQEGDLEQRAPAAPELA